MKCDDARARFLAGDADQAALDHLGTCPDCRIEWASLEDSRRALDDPVFWEEPSATLEDRVVAMIAGPSPATSRVSMPIGRMGWWAVGGTAAVAVLVVAVWAGLRSPGPDWRIDLPGTAQAPTAMGVVEGWNEPGGTRLALDIDGLPPAPEGSVYEFWFSRDELHISAGTFISPDQVELWVGVSRAEFPRLWITLEPLDDDESPSGLNVMDTT